MWIARDEDNSLNLFNSRPRLQFEGGEGFWQCTDNYDFVGLDENLYPQITFENSPQEIEIKIKQQ